MNLRRLLLIAGRQWATVLFSLTAVQSTAGGEIPGTQPLNLTGDISQQMMIAADRFIDRERTAAINDRERFWQVDFTSREAFEKSIQPNRARLARMLGAVDARIENPRMEYVADVMTPVVLARTDQFEIYAVRWPVLDGVNGEGLLLQPRGRVIARVVAIPDADQSPEMISGLAPGLPDGLQFARRLAENGCQVIVPALIDRNCTYSGSARLGAFTNMPHREWLYRPAFIMGRHIIGYEVQKVRSAIDWLTQQNNTAGAAPIGVVGWGEGGLLAFHTAALDTRVRSVLVSGHFGPRENLWREPLYRNLFGLLREFGDAETARLIVPRTLIVEHAPAPAIAGPPAPSPGRAGAAAGRIETPSFERVQAEVTRARKFAGPYGEAIQLCHGDSDTTTGPIAEPTLAAFLRSLGRTEALNPGGEHPNVDLTKIDAPGRQRRLVAEIERHTQRLLQLSAEVRDAYLWKKVRPTTPEAWREAMPPYRKTLWNDVVGRFPSGHLPINPRSRQILDRPNWTAHEVVFDVLPELFGWGYFLLPKGIKPGEKRPVVVVQHGNNGVPADTINEDTATQAYRYYKAFGARLAERGFIVFAPHMLTGGPLVGGEVHGRPDPRLLHRKANALGQSLFSLTIAQHDVMLTWLETQPQVDPKRIGFYGLSSGGKAAMRIPAVLERYALSICSGDFNEWIWKNVTNDHTTSVIFKAHFDIAEFNIGHTLSYAEMAALIAPRPFMVERGHNDAVGIDEWVAWEYARVNRLYSKLRISDRTEIEYFDGPHTINAVGTFRFLHRHLNWPEPAGAQ